MELHLFSHGRVTQAWTYDAKAPLVASPAVVGHMIVLGTRDGRVICLDQHGKERWVFQARESLSVTDSFFVDQERVHSIDSPPVLADVDNDGEEEVLAGTELGMLYCISSSGKLKWSHDCKASIRAGALVADINGDGKQEVLIGSSDGKLTALTSDGKLIFEYDADAPIESTPGLLWSSRHRKASIVFGTAKGDLIAITPGQELEWRVPLGEKITAKPAFFRTPEEDRMIIGTLGGKLCCVSEHGEAVWTFLTNGSIYSEAAISDLDEDGRPEVLFSSCDNTVYALTTDGKRLWSYETDFWVTATPKVADIDGDGKPEVIAGSYDHSVYVFDGKGTFMLDYVPGLSGIVTQAGHYANILTAEPGEQTGKKLFQLQLDSIVVGCAVIDAPEPTILASTKTGKLHAIVHVK